MRRQRTRPPLTYILWGVVLGAGGMCCVLNTAWVALLRAAAGN